jgi:uncharacterized membrane protein affecting hemolysin expression
MALSQQQKRKKRINKLKTNLIISVLSLGLILSSMLTGKTRAPKIPAKQDTVVKANRDSIKKVGSLKTD